MRKIICVTVAAGSFVGLLFSAYFAWKSGQAYNAEAKYLLLFAIPAIMSILFYPAKKKPSNQVGFVASDSNQVGFLNE